MKIVLRHDMAGHEFMNATVIETGRSYNGSGIEYFGGADSWPRVTLKVSLNAGEERLAEELAERLATTVEEFLEDNLKHYEREGRE